MSKDWETYSTHVDGRPASVFVDMGIADDAPLARLTIVAWVKLRLRHPREDGLASEDENAALQAIDDALKSGLVSKMTACVGNITLDGHRDFYFYTSLAQAWKERAHHALQAFTDYQFTCGSRPDREWDLYFELLSPADEDRASIENRRLCDALKQGGDRFERERPIEHAAFFRDSASRDKFIAKAIELHCNVIELVEPEERGEQFGVRLSSTGIPSHDNIDALTLPLYRAASDFGGEYEGWETQVVR